MAYLESPATHPARGARARLAGLRLLVLALGVGLGLGLPLDFLARQQAPPAALQPGQETPPPSGSSAETGLEILRIELPEVSLAALRDARRRALERSIIAPEDKTPVPGRVIFAARELEADVRLKGDWTDHLDGPQWSYRIRLRDGTFHGMREFSIQAPKTRNFLWEWLVLSCGRLEGLLTPRVSFVEVVQNGQRMGVYFVEEHFEKELLESQGRREGPIVAWDESTLWSTYMREGQVPSKGQTGLTSAVSDVAESIGPAPVRGYDARRTRADPAYAQSFAAALDAMEGLRALALEQSPDTPLMRRLQARVERRGRTLAELVDIESVARAHALLSLFQVVHPLAWHNLRFYYDPCAARLEPILFDNMAGVTAVRDPIPWRASGIAAVFAEDQDYLHGVFRHLGRMLAPDWLTTVWARLEPELAAHERALLTAGALPAGFTMENMERRLRAQVDALARLCAPEDLVGYEAEWVAGQLELSVWCSTRAPACIVGLRMPNGERLGAREHLLGPSRTERPREGLPHPDHVTLPPSGCPLTFRFPLTEARGARGQLQLLVYPMAALEGDTRALDIRPIAPDGAAPAPAARGEQDHEADLRRLLERHPFLWRDPSTATLRVLPGTWDVLTELTIPAELSLVLSAGTTLRFAADAGIRSHSALELHGHPKRPIELVPLEEGDARDGSEAWSGIHVYAAASRSLWENVLVRGGNVRFEGSAARLRGCRFDTADLVLEGADFDLDGIVSEGAGAAGLSGDGVTATLTNCAFRSGRNGIAFWRSSVGVRRCTFGSLTGEAMAFCEWTRAHVEDVSLTTVSRGVVARGASEVDVATLSLDGSPAYAFLSLQGRAEEPSTLRVRGVRIGAEAESLAEVGCTLTIDDVLEPGRAVDRAISRGAQSRPPRR